METFVLPARQRKKLGPLIQQLKEVGFTRLVYPRRNLTVEKWQDKDSMDYQIQLGKNEIQLKYSADAKNKRQRFLEVMPVFLNVLNLAQPFYDMQPSPLFKVFLDFMQGIRSHSGKDTLDLATELDEVKIRQADLRKKYDALVRSSEENARILLECERRRDELYKRVGNLEGLSDEALKQAASEKLLDAVLNKPVTASMLFDTIVDIGSNQGGLSLLSAQPGTNTDLTGLRVLLVEDNEFNQQLATALLVRAGIEVSLARDGIEAVQAVQPGRFDAVLMDIQMRRMDGLEATRNIRSNPALADLPIIAMTANAMVGDRELCLAAGMNDYVAKPIQIEVLYFTLARWTQRNVQFTEPVAPNVRRVSGTFPAIDPARAIASMGGEDTYLTVLDKFIFNQGQAVQSIQDALAAADRKTAERLAHTLKGIAATIGASALAESARQLEIAILKEDTENRQRLIATIKKELAQVIASAKAYLQAHAAETGTATPDPAQLDALLEQLAGQLRAFDSGAGDTMRQINRQIKGSPTVARLAKLDRYIKDYDYENALAEVQRIAKEMT